MSLLFKKFRILSKHGRDSGRVAPMAFPTVVLTIYGDDDALVTARHRSQNIPVIITLNRNCNSKC